MYFSDSKDLWFIKIDFATFSIAGCIAHHHRLEASEDDNPQGPGTFSSIGGRDVMDCPGSPMGSIGISSNLVDFAKPKGYP